jgi:O-antigen ligase
LLKVKIDFIVILIGLFIISVNTMFMPIVKEGVFFILFTIVISLMLKENEYKLLYIIVMHTIILLCTFSFIVYWDISKNEYQLFLYRKFQYIFVMFSPFIFYSYTKNKNIINSINIAMLIVILFLFINIIMNLGTFEIGKFSGFLLSRPGAGVIALMPFLYFLYVRKFGIDNSLLLNFYLIISTIVALIYIIYTGSKTAGYGLVIIFGILLINNFNLSFKKLFFVLVGLGLFYIFVPIEYFSDLLKFNKGVELSSSIQRFIEWNIAIDIIKEHWLFGVGWKNYPDMINNSLIAYGKDLFPFIQWKYYLNLAGDSSSQNVLLDNIAIYGIFGIIYDIFLFYVLFIVYKIDGIKSYILAFLIILLMTNNFNFGNGYEPVFWFLVGIVILKDELKEETMYYEHNC